MMVIYLPVNDLSAALIEEMAKKYKVCGSNSDDAMCEILAKITGVECYMSMIASDQETPTFEFIKNSDAVKHKLEWGGDITFGDAVEYDHDPLLGEL